MRAYADLWQAVLYVHEPVCQPAGVATLSTYENCQPMFICHRSDMEIAIFSVKSPLTASSDAVHRPSSACNSVQDLLSNSEDTHQPSPAKSAELIQILPAIRITAHS